MNLTDPAGLETGHPPYGGPGDRPGPNGDCGCNYDPTEGMEANPFFNPFEWIMFWAGGKIGAMGQGADQGLTTFGPGSLGAAENVPQLTRELLSQSRVIAKGRNIRDVEGLVEQYGGKARDWVKKSSPPIEINGTPAEIHWYECQGIGRVKEKINWLDD